MFYEDAIDSLCPSAYAFAVENEKLSVVGRPAVTNVEVTDDKKAVLTFTAALYPEVKLGEYKGVEAPKETVRITAADIDKEIENIRKRNARIETVDRPAADGDTAVIDFEGFVDGKAFDGGKGENYSLVLGSGQFIPGFEDQVVGMSAGEEKDVNVTFPKEYTEELAGKDATFKVKLHEVKESILPEVDDEFAKDVSEFDTLEEYKKSISAKLREQREAAAKRAFEDAAMDAVIDGMEAEIPDAMVDEQIENMMGEYEYRLSAQGLNIEQYCQMLGMDKASFQATMRPAALKQIQTRLVLEKVAELENIEVSDEELEEEYKKLAENYSMEVDQVKAAVNAQFLRVDLKNEKAAKVIYDNAVKAKKTTKKTAKKAEEKTEDTAETEKAAE